MLVTEAGMVIDVKHVAFLNAFDPILETPFGIVTDVIFDAFKNASLPIIV